MKQIKQLPTLTNPEDIKKWVLDNLDHIEDYFPHDDNEESKEFKEQIKLALVNKVVEK